LQKVLDNWRIMRYYLVMGCTVQPDTKEIRMTTTVYATSDTEARVVFSGEKNVYEIGDSYPETQIHVHKRAPYWYNERGDQLFGGYGGVGPALMAETAMDLPCDRLIDERVVE